MRTFLVCLAFLLASCGGGERINAIPVVEESVTGILLTFGDMSSGDLAPREVQVWLPPGYDDSDARYPVLYMHDGQNIFETGNSYTGDEWGVDETMTRLIEAGTIEPVIVVGIANTSNRWADYAPQKVVEMWPEARLEEMHKEVSVLYADQYLEFIVNDIKPMIDGQFRTQTGPEGTMLAGSSMGGLITLYALAEYPDVFGGGACISIHWPLADPDRDDALDAVTYLQAYLGESGLAPSRQRIWFDRGTETLDAYYEPYAEQMEAWFAGKYSEGAGNVAFRAYPGTEHNEQAWAARLADPLTFLFGTEGAAE